MPGDTTAANLKTLDFSTLSEFLVHTGQRRIDVIELAEFSRLYGKKLDFSVR